MKREREKRENVMKWNETRMLGGAMTRRAANGLCTPVWCVLEKEKERERWWLILLSVVLGYIFCLRSSVDEVDTEVEREVKEASGNPGNSWCTQFSSVQCSARCATSPKSRRLRRPQQRLLRPRPLPPAVHCGDGGGGDNGGSHDASPTVPGSVRGGCSSPDCCAERGAGSRQVKSAGGGGAVLLLLLLRRRRHHLPHRCSSTRRPPLSRSHFQFPLSPRRIRCWPLCCHCRRCQFLLALHYRRRRRPLRRALNWASPGRLNWSSA